MDIPKFRVSEITDILKEIIETGFPDIEIEGEISNYRPSSSGHCYFSLKDENAMISAVLFRRQAAALDFRPEDGQKVIARGRLSVYSQRGNYQIICESLKQAGRGSILAMLEERKRRLAEEGLFATERKKPLPPYPKTVGVVTSPTGAALRDILQVMNRRHAGVRILIAPCPVQGDAAAPKIAAQIRRLNDFNLCDVMIIGRGGGSLEDLLPFSDESVVRAVAESAIPVISGVGHEIDFALSDFAADIRAATPSAAAELVSAKSSELEERVANISEILTSHMRSRLDQVKLQLSAFSHQEMERTFRMRLQPLMLRLDDAKERLLLQFRSALDKRRHALELLTGRLEENSPLTIMERGYAFISDGETGKPVKSVAEFRTGQSVDIRLHDGRAVSEIKEINHEKL